MSECRETKYGKGLIATGLDMPPENKAIHLAMKLVEQRFKNLGMPMETFWSNWEDPRESFYQKLQRINSKVETAANDERQIIPMIGISYGQQLALRMALGRNQKHVNGIVGVVPVSRGMGQDGGQFDEQHRVIEQMGFAPFGSTSSAETVEDIERYLDPKLLEKIRSMALISKNDELVPQGMATLPGAVFVDASTWKKWREVNHDVPTDPLLTIKSPYKGHAMTGAFLMLFNTKMIVDRFKQEK